MPKFNERLKLLRINAALSQAELGKHIGVSKSSINMYERGEREPSIETLEAIADFFNVDMDYLLGKSEHKNKTDWLATLDTESFTRLDNNTFSEQPTSEDYLHTVITEMKKGGKAPISIMGSEGNNMYIPVDNKDEYELVTSILKTLRKSKEKDSKDGTEKV